LNLRNIAAIFNFLRGSLESLLILMRFHPDIVVGFGSIACIPLVLLAWVFRMKTVIHEQNVIAGLANKVMSAFTDKIAISFVKTKEYLSRYQNKLVLTGNPLRKELILVEKNKALDFFQFKPDKYTILVSGGSQGSSSINKEFLQAISRLSAQFDFQVIHLAGANDYAQVKNAYENLNITSRVFGFFKDMQYAYSAADLAVCRAGAITITELMFFKLPAVICPYPYAYQHQRANAEVLKTMGSAIIIEDSRLQEGKLTETIKSVFLDPAKLKNMRHAYNNITVTSTNELLVDAVMSVK
jgi:UDP-N-acetylglucosamine--N-acetylmuramyl-(pentapeptide) pyrophosphoryl-undecaprenol N-acetylglucosamine transferase